MSNNVRRLETETVEDTHEIGGEVFDDPGTRRNGGTAVSTRVDTNRPPAVPKGLGLRTKDPMIPRKTMQKEDRRTVALVDEMEIDLFSHG